MIWCYSEWRSAYEEINTKFVEGLTEEDCDLIIIDDLMDEFKKVVYLFTKKSHHRNTSVVFVVQNTLKRLENYKSERTLLGSVLKPRRQRSDNLPGEENG